MSFRNIEPFVALLLMLATTAFVAFKGGKPERLATAMIVVSWISTLVMQAPGHQTAVTFLVFDGLLAVGFLAVAVRYSSLWLAGAMICQAVSFGAHAMRLSDNSSVYWHGANVYILVINIVSYLVLLILIGGTVATIRRRRRADREKVEDRARIVKRPDWLTDATPPTAGAL